MRVTAWRACLARADILSRSDASRPIAASIRRPACTTPHTSAMYSFSTSRSWNCRASSWWAASCLATTIRPEVPRSSRWTMPGRSSPPMPLRSSMWCRSALTSVPEGCPAPGCTTMPAGLSMTATSSSWYSTSMGRSSAPACDGTASGSRTSTRSPSLKSGVGLGRPRAERHQAIGDELLDLRAGVRLQHRDQEAVEPLPHVLGAGDELERLRRHGGARVLPAGPSASAAPATPASRG